MADEIDPRNPFLGALEGLAAVEAAGSVEAALRAAVEAACLVTASRRGLAGLFDGEAVTAGEWFDLEDGWTGAPLRWELGEGAPGRVCESGTPLACNEVPETAECLPETTGVLRLTRFACVPIESADGARLGFVEVGDRATAYTADEVRCLRLVARHAARRLAALAGHERRNAEQRLCTEALLGGRELFSLDADEVLAETAARARDLTGADDVAVLRLESRRELEAADLGDEERAVLEETARTVCSALFSSAMSRRRSPARAARRSPPSLREPASPSSTRCSTAPRPTSLAACRSACCRSSRPPSPASISPWPTAPPATAPAEAATSSTSTARPTATSPSSWATSPARVSTPSRRRSSSSTPSAPP